MRKFTILLFAFINFYNINAQTKQKPIIIAGLLDSISSDITKTTYKLLVLKIFSGQYYSNTISVENHIMAKNDKVGDTLLLEVWKRNNNYYFYEDLNSFSPVGSFYKIDQRHLYYFQINSYEELVNMLSDYYNKINVSDDQRRLKNILAIIYKKEQAIYIKYAALKNLRVFSQNTCFPVSYIKKELIKIYNDTVLEKKIRKQAIQTVGFSKELNYSLYDYNIANNLYQTLYPNNTKSYLEYIVPFWKKGITFCDSLINKYETIILDFPAIKDSISLSKRDNLFFSGKIKKVSKNKLTIKKLTIFEGKYAEDEITVRTDIDTTFNKEITGKNVLINATLINNKFILKLSHRNKGFSKPPLTPDGNNLFIINEANLNKNGIKIKPNEFLKVITDYYLILNSYIKNKEKELIKNIIKGKYLFLRQRSLWEFSDLSVQYDSLCWDFNKKYNFLDSLSKKFGKYKAPSISVIATADLLLTKSFNQNYSSKYNTNVYELDYHKNLYQLQRLEGFLNSKNIFAQQYAVMRFQDLIKYYTNLKKILNSRIEKYDN